MKIGIVLVTFNRIDKLKIALQHYKKQSYPFEYIVIVDNHSTDGTAEFLKEWLSEKDSFQKYCVTLDSNTGGAGGFYVGMKKALSLDADWVWLSDDDAYPRPNAFEKIAEYYESRLPEEQKRIVALCSAVYNKGQIHKEHRNHLNVSRWKVKIQPTTLDEYKSEAIKIDIFSYVGAAIKKSALLEVGLDRKEFFIYCDDQEHSLRLGRAGDIFCVTSSIVDHDTPPFDPKVINWGRYYKRRNDLLMIKLNFPYRYYFLRYWKRYWLDVSFHSKNAKVLKKLLRAAHSDAWRNRTGVHEVYKPGWNPEEDVE